jgi:hypothetical protein
MALAMSETPPAPQTPQPPAFDADAPPTTRLDPRRIIETVALLRERVRERFPGSSLGRLADDLLRIAQDTVPRVEWIGRPHLPVRAGLAAILLLVVALLGGVALRFNLRPQVNDLNALVALVESVINDVVLLGAAMLFLFTVEGRIKRRRALGFIRELRALAHLVDIHQLTKDPDRMVRAGEDTPSSPRRAMTPFEVSRYLDYCSEMLSLTSKIAALYAQNFDDPVVLAAVDEVETLTTGLSGKIWQKILVLTYAEDPSRLR